MQRLYLSVFSKLKNHIKKIENRPGLWMFTLIVSGIVSLITFIIYNRISPFSPSKDFENIFISLLYFSRTVMTPFSFVLSFWLITDFLKKKMTSEISNREFLSKASVFALIGIVFTSLLVWKSVLISVIARAFVGFVYSCVMYDKFNENLLNKVTLIAFVIAAIVDVIGYALGFTVLFLIAIL